jgi:AbrB family looped-hinge helix DNA binding protein
MTTKLSTKGQVVLPKDIRRKMNLRPGDQFDTRIDGEGILLVPKRKRPRKYRITKDPITDLPVITGGKDAPRLTNEEVIEMLADFP